MEEWRPIENFEEFYEISSFGRIRRIHKDPRVQKYKILTLDTLRGYKKVTLYKFGVGYKFQVHRLVAKTFIPNPNSLPQVNHKDENPSNNNVENLEWCTPEYNVRYGTGIRRQVEKRSKVVEQYTLNGEFIADFASTQEAAKILNIRQSSISNCCNGGYWRDKHTKFIKCNRAGNFKFKFKEQ